MQQAGAIARMPEGKARNLYLALREEVATGNRPDCSMLPGEQRLAETFGVSRVTVRRVLDAQARDGLIERRPYAGTMIRRGAPQGAALSADLATLMPSLIGGYHGPPIGVVRGSFLALFPSTLSSTSAPVEGSAAWFAKITTIRGFLPS